jgi:hypothetical protein
MRTMYNNKKIFMIEYVIARASTVDVLGGESVVIQAGKAWDKIQELGKEEVNNEKDKEHE